MRYLVSLTLILALGALGAACGGSDVRPPMPDPSSIDQSADDMGLAALEEETAGSESASPPSEAGDEAEGDAASEAPLRGATLVRGEHTPIEGRAPTLRIAAPRSGSTVRTGSVMLRLAVTGWPLEAPAGRHVHVIVDDEPYIAVRDVSAPIDLNALVAANLGHELAEGTHVVRVFPSRGHHESVKEPGAFAVTVVHFRRATEGFAFDAAAPLLTYSRPKGCNAAGERVLLDFYVSGATLGADAHRVRYTLDGRSGEITEWAPHWMEGLRAGEHTLRLELLAPDGSAVPGMFNDTTRTFTVAASCP